MSYKIAVGSSDGELVDLKFGEVKAFRIYEVSDGGIGLSEIRDVSQAEGEAAGEASGEAEIGCSSSGCDSGGCGGGGNGCGGSGNGCGGSAGITGRVLAISDCRCVVCKKIGFQAQKQFEKKAISVFDVECTVEEALEKISFYYGKVDKHEAFRREGK